MLDLLFLYSDALRSFSDPISLTAAINVFRLAFDLEARHVALAGTSNDFPSGAIQSLL